MTEQSTIHYERTSPQVAKITFANPPVNLIVGETVLRLTEIVDEFATDPDIQVVVFDSGVPDFFFNHFDLAAAADFPAPEGEDAVPVWTDLVLKTLQGPLHHASRPSEAAPAVAATSSPSRSTCATPAGRRRSSGSPRSAAVCCPVVAARSGFRDTIGRDRALEVILTSADYDASTAERWGWVTRALPDAELDAFVDAIVARLASFDRTSLASAKAMVNRASLPPDADLVAAYGEFAHSLTLPGFLTRAAGTQALSQSRPASTWSTDSASTSASPTSGADTGHHE